MAYNLYFILPTILIGVILGFLAPRDPRSALAAIIAYLALTLWASIVVNIKRLHDLHYSGWWLLVWWGVSAGIVLLQMPNSPILAKAVSLLLAVLLMTVPGTHGPNRFGEKP